MYKNTYTYPELPKIPSPIQTFTVGPGFTPGPPLGINAARVTD